MDPFSNINSYWDLVQQPSGFSTIGDDDFLALLQKQFPTTVGNSPKPYEQPPPDGVDPQSISTFPLPNASPSSSDSSPSPPSANDNSPSSRPQSGVFSPSSEQASEDPSLKRKASDEDMDAEPSAKNAHLNGSALGRKSVSSSSRRKSTGNPQQDEFRLLKRKEQNRAAQRAFRERKEKHVKDLEDKVADLEAKNQAAESENENLRDLLSRLQSENMALKQAQFTFSVPKNPDVHVPQTYNSPTPTTNEQFRFQGAGPSSSKQPASNVHSPVPPPFDFNFGSMIPFDPAVLNVLDDSSSQSQQPAGDAMNMDFSFPAVQPRMLASNPTYMSFGEPMALDHIPSSNGATPQSGMDSMGMATFGDWSPPSDTGLSPQDSFDQLFGGNYMGAQSPVDFSALLRTPPSTISPVQHALRTPGSISSLTPNSSSESSNTTTTSASPASSATPVSMQNATPPMGHNPMDCPKTKEQMAAVIRNAGSSTFVDSPPPPPALLRKACDSDSGNAMIMCQGSSFPKTEKSDKNIEVLTAWRSITSNPHFKDVDINDLCTEFTAKARCDGTKVVLEPEGVTHIIETLSAKRKQQQEHQKQQSAQQSQ
ncbi:hypothetical protein QCA50_008473 [Cerrena zonata]|uniref:BZIP domain-containing protein n=1 Tax=Cerrena zonata TaxID=2478898 RepID=A0AAW0G319_9APHY